MTVHAPPAQDVKARLLADLLRAVAEGHVLQATAVGLLVERNAYDMVRQAHANAPGKSEDLEARLQLHLHNVVTVLGTAERHLGDVRRAVKWYRTDAPSGQTPEAHTVAGRLEEAYRLLLRTPAAGARPRA